MPLEPKTGELADTAFFLLERLAVVEFENVAQLLHRPAFGDGAEGMARATLTLNPSPRGRGNEFHLLVAGKAEVDEPLAVEGAGHLLQDPDAPLAVLDQLAVGR